MGLQLDAQLVFSLQSKVFPASILAGAKDSNMELFGFGSHLIVDCYHADAEKLAMPEFIRQTLEEFPKHLGFTQVSPAQIFSRPGIHPEMAGTSGVVLLAESHIAIHAFPKKRILSLDVFSNKEFDTQAIVAKLNEAFDVGRIETSFINRGRELPRDAKLTEQIVSGEREYIEARIT